MAVAARLKMRPGLSPFATRLDEALRRLPSLPPRFLLACSGGPDSVALAHALSELAAHRKLHVEIGHVNHRLRGRESAADQKFVEDLGRRLGWRVHVMARPVARSGGNLEEKARDLRYEALGGLARRRKLAVLTAHTMDDQAETVIMNLLRGAGPDGLGGMRPARLDAGSGVMIARPLLQVDRAAVRAYAESKGRFREDSSNRDTKFLRNYIRMNMFHDLEGRSPGFQERIARLADLVREQLPVLEDLADQAHKRVGRPHRRGWLLDGRRFRKEPVAIQRRVLRKAAGRDLLTFDGVERLRIWMASPPSSGRIWQLRKGWIVERLSKSHGSPSPALFWFRPPKKGR